MRKYGVIIAIATPLLGIFLSASGQAAVFAVNSPFDESDASPGNGICETIPGNGVCTLRAAIEETNALAGDDAIILPTNTYLPTQVTELNITGNLTITGSGAATTIIDGNKTVRPNSGVLRIDPGGIVNISGVTIRNGGRIVGLGGGIANLSGGTLTLTNAWVSGNSASLGGGISNSGVLTLTNSTVSGNTGGGIFHQGDTLTLSNSTVSGNTGGGIFNNESSALALTNSTVSGNSAGGAVGGGIRNFGTATLTNSTVSGNSGSRGGGIFNQIGTLILSNSTVSGNVATGSGGGIWNEAGATFNFQNTIPAGNFIFGSPNPSDCGGTINLNGNNLMGILDCLVIGGGITVADPKLGPLQNNGGPTQTHALLSGSPAIDAGNSNGCRDQFGALLLQDQRGFRRTLDGNLDGTTRCDIGSSEFDSGAEVTPVVDFDGDGRSDIAIYRDGGWYVLRSLDGGVTATGWGGLPQDIPVPGDYDGDGRTDIAVYRDGVWFVLLSSGGVIATGWGGLAQDIPVPGDYDGDGKTDMAVYRDGTWFILRSSDGGVAATGWGGLPQDVPVSSDYDGDGRTDIAVYRDGEWFVLRSSDGGITYMGWGGLPQDIPVPADYDGDEKADITVYRDGLWFVLRSSDAGVTTTGWGGLPQMCWFRVTMTETERPTLLCTGMERGLSFDLLTVVSQREVGAGSHRTYL